MLSFLLLFFFFQNLQAAFLYIPLRMQCEIEISAIIGALPFTNTSINIKLRKNDPVIKTEN